MATIQVRNLPDDVHAELRRRAADAHQSLQQYVRGRLIAEAERRPIDELFTAAKAGRGGSLTLEEATRWIREDRESH